MAKRAIIVAGPESSGTRLATRMLIAAGCLGEGGHKQAFDEDGPPAKLSGANAIVWRRSLPHAGKWPSLSEMAHKCASRGYDVGFVVTVREWWAMALSQQANGHVPNKSRALENIQHSIFFVLDEARKFTPHPDFMVVTYESIILNPNMAVQSMTSHFGIKPKKGTGEPSFERVENKNQKRYLESPPNW